MLILVRKINISKRFKPWTLTLHLNKICNVDSNKIGSNGPMLITMVKVE